MQGLPDHAHVPTLQRLPKDLPIVASPAGAQVATGLGFSNITALDHGEETTIAGGKLKIRATAGSLQCHHPNQLRASERFRILGICRHAQDSFLDTWSCSICLLHFVNSFQCVQCQRVCEEK